MFKERKLRHEMRGKICLTNGLMENVLPPVAQLLGLTDLTGGLTGADRFIN